MNQLQNQKRNEARSAAKSLPESFTSFLMIIWEYVLLAICNRLPANEKHYVSEVKFSNLSAVNRHTMKQAEVGSPIVIAQIS